MADLQSYDPDWHKKLIGHHEELPALWKLAVAEKREYGRINPDTKARYIQAIRAMRAARMRKFRTTTDVANKVFNVLICRAALEGQRFETKRLASDFNSFAEIREFLVTETQRIKNVGRINKQATHTLPVLPKGEGDIFKGASDSLVWTQAFFLADVGGGLPFILITEKTQQGRNICITGRSSHQRFHRFLPKIAQLLSERLFADEDRGGFRFYVHNPVLPTVRHHEQFWRYDLRAGAQNAFYFHGFYSVPVLPNAIAYKKFADGLDEKHTSILPLDKYTAFAPVVDALMNRQESRPRPYSFFM